MAVTNTQRTLALLKKQGLPCQVVEKWVSYPKKPGQPGPPGVRIDLFNIIDILCLDYDRGVVGIQVCSGSGYAAHFRKITDEQRDNTRKWLATPGTVLEIWAWRKLKKVRGGKATIWEPRIVEIMLSDIVRE